MLTDYHLHAQPDGLAARAAAAAGWDEHGGPWTPGWLGRYVAAARSRAVGEIAVTEHVHRFTAARGWVDRPFWAEECTEDLSRYVEGVTAARESGLPVLLGIEMDWLPHRADDIARLLDAAPFDIVLGSVHWLDGLAVDDPSQPPIPATPADEVWHRYLDQLLAAAESGLFDVLAHPDLPKVFGHHPPRGVVERFPEVVERIAAAGVAVECSSAGLRKPVGELYPSPDLLAMCCRAGVPVTLSSDAHRPEDVAAGYPTAVAALRGAGYRTLTRFRRRTPRQEALAEWG